MDLVTRLDDRLKAASTRARNNKTLVNDARADRALRKSQNLQDVPVSELIPKRKPTTLEPLPFELNN